MSSSPSTPQHVLTQIAEAEVALLKTPLLAFAQALASPGANLLTVQNAAANVLLQVPQLSAPAQTAALNIVGNGLTAWISAIGNTPATAASTSSAS